MLIKRKSTANGDLADSLPEPSAENASEISYIIQDFLYA